MNELNSLIKLINNNNHVDDDCIKQLEAQRAAFNGVKVIESSMLGPNEIMLVCGTEAYKKIKEAGL